MAEITSADSPPPPPAGAGEGEAAQCRKTKPGTKRLLLVLSVVLSFISGLPFLLKSVEIYRSSLPFDSIDALSLRVHSDLVSSPCHFQAVFIDSGGGAADPGRVQRLIADDMRRRLGGGSACGRCGHNFTISVTTESGGRCVRDGTGADEACPWKCGAVDLSDFDGHTDEVLDELLLSALPTDGGEVSISGGSRVYTVVVMERENGRSETEPRIVVGKHRHAWITGKISETDAAYIIGNLFVKFFMNGGKTETQLKEATEDFMPVGADGSIVLSFSLLNADPTDWVYDWEFQAMERIILAPILEALSPIANISIESQVLYHTPKSANSHWDKKLGSNVFSIRDLPFFVNSNEWHLDSSITAAGRSKVLQFVVYIPSARECPLLLQLPGGEISKTNGFISPMWGGVVVWNPPICSEHSQRNFVKGVVSSQELQKIFQVFIAQLRMLFGVDSNHFDASEIGESKFLDSKRGFTEWELDVLYRRHTCFNLLSCATTLKSLSKLVQSLPRMIIMDEIGKQVKFSLEAASLAQQNASLGVYDAFAVSSRLARALAEDAFFHPSIMSISYYSFEHYFAVYMPFFAPVALHVLLATIKELKRYKKEKAKYMAFIAAEQAKKSS